MWRNRAGAYAMMMSRMRAAGQRRLALASVAGAAAVVAAASFMPATTSSSSSSSSLLDSDSGSSLHRFRSSSFSPSSSLTLCERPSSSKQDDEKASMMSQRTLRKRQTLQQAVEQVGPPSPALLLLKRANTQQELDRLRPGKAEMLKRWERDEDGWRDLPARAWPAYQPDEEELVGLQAQVAQHDCRRLAAAAAAAAAADATSSSWWRTMFQSKNNNNNNKPSELCTELLFHVATAQVFCTIDPAAGLKQYQQLAEQGHVDSMVACGVVLVEGLGVPHCEEEGIEWLLKAEKLGSSQACYELGTVYYTGIDGVVDEDPVAAFQLFERAARHNHTAAMYMMADCLLEGEGTEKSVARAIPLLYQAADRGHRFARQRIRELLKN